MAAVTCIIGLQYGHVLVHFEVMWAYQVVFPYALWDFFFIQASISKSLAIL